MVSLTELQEVPPESMMLLVGPPGSGKSTFCQKAVLGKIERKPVVYVTAESATGLAGNLFSAVYRYIMESRLVAFGDPYCDWGFRR